MITNFEIENAPMMEVDTVMARIKDEEPSTHLEITFLEGKLKGKVLLLGEWSFDVPDEFADEGNTSFNAIFVDFTTEESDVLIADNAQLISEIARAIITEAVENYEMEGSNV